jgi:hypothetical protein
MQKETVKTNTETDSPAIYLAKGNVVAQHLVTGL